MEQIPRGSVVSILKALLVTEEEIARLSRSPSQREYYDGRLSGLRTALEVLEMNENDVLPKIDQADTPEPAQALQGLVAACTRYDEAPDSTLAHASYQSALASARSALKSE